MELFFTHLLKSSGILLLFLLSYYLFLRKETFFNGNRLFLIAGLIIAIGLPFITITKTILVTPSPMSQNDLYLIGEVTTNTPVGSVFNWTSILIAIYLLGVFYFSVKLLLQLAKIKKIKKTSAIIEDEKFYHVQTKKQISPFSFFKHIFYYPKQFKEAELNTIIKHEKVHASELHSLDILVTEIVFIILWFNPVIWLYRISIKQNLEFLADAKTCALDHNKKHYQYLMLKQALGNHNLSIANPFYNSIIKKRIVMLNQNQSKSINRLKLLVVLPFLAIFLFAFNTKTEYKMLPKDTITLVNNGISFRYVLQKNTTDNQLLKIKNELHKKNIDFSYTIVRNTVKEIISISFDLEGFVNEEKLISGNYETNTENPIKDILLKFDEGDNEFYIGEKVKETTGVKEDNAVIAEFKITNVTIDVDENSANKQLQKDAGFLEERGVKVQFKSIKRNSNGKIKDIKVVYDNGAGDKGTYQQKKSTAITPFTIVVNFKDDVPPEITVSAAEVAYSKNEHLNTWFASDSANNEITKDSSITRYTRLGTDYEKTQINRQEKGISIETDKAGNDYIRLKSEGPKKPLFLVDGEEVENIESINNDEIDSMEILTEKEALEKYGIKGANGVVEVITKTEPLYYIDGEKSTKKTVTELDQDKVKSINILKGEAAKEKYGATGGNGVVEIIIKTVAEEKHELKVENVIAEAIAKLPNEALYFIDGKESNREEMRTLNPDNIASVFVIKNKNATDRYGERGKNGVLVVTTKKEK